MTQSPHNQWELGVQKGAALVLPHQAGWADEFHAEKGRLLQGFESPPPLEHVGSTAVPGLAAKPIIDILMGFRDETEYEACRTALKQLNYEYKGDPFTRGDHIYILTHDGFTHTHKIHLTAHGGEEWMRKTAFRDYLIAHPDRARAYGDLKTRLARRFPNNRREYSRLKSEFIQAVLRDTPTK